MPSHKAPNRATAPARPQPQPTTRSPRKTRPGISKADLSDAHSLLVAVALVSPPGVGAVLLALGDFLGKVEREAL